ncbi:hypothetical protein Tco_0034781, partial [Tanacetum coccineum]
PDLPRRRKPWDCYDPLTIVMFRSVVVPLFLLEFATPPFSVVPLLRPTIAGTPDTSWYVMQTTTMYQSDGGGLMHHVLESALIVVYEFAVIMY